MRRFIRSTLLIITAGFMLVGCQQNEQHVGEKISLAEE